MKHILHTLDNENGSVIVIAILVLALLTIVGISGLNTTSTEIQIARNDKLYKIAFYGAENGTEVGHELLEQNIEGATGFNDDNVYNDVKITTGNFFLNPTATCPTDANRDIYFPQDYSAGEPHTNITYGGVTEQAEGGAIQMMAGYEGKGKSSAAGGIHRIYDIYAKHEGGSSGGTATVLLEWRVVGG